jgi:hypothetical protein
LLHEGKAGGLSIQASVHDFGNHGQLDFGRPAGHVNVAIIAAAGNRMRGVEVSIEFELDGNSGAVHVPVHEIKAQV